MNIKKYLNKEFGSIEDPIKLNLKILNFVGVFSKNVFVFWIFNFLTIILVISLLLNTVVYYKKSSKSVVSGFFVLSMVTAWVKNIIFKNNRNKTLKLVKILNNPLLKPRTHLQKKMIEDENTKIISVMFSFYVSLIIFTTTWICYSLISRRLMFDMWLPVDREESPFYEIVFLAQILFLVLSVIFLICSDLIVYGFVNVISLECEMLCDSLRNIYEISKEDLVKRHKTVSEENIYENMETSLYSFINQHQFIIKLMKKFDLNYKSYIFTLFSTEVIISCIIFLQISEVHTLDQVIFFASYQLNNFVEIFIFCYFSQNLITNSEKIFYAAYETPWIFASKRFKNDILIFMWRVKEPLVVVTGNFFLYRCRLFLTLLQLRIAIPL